MFFIALSGGMNLQAGGLFGDTPDEPLLEITGAVELTIGTDSGHARHALRAHRLRARSP